QGRPTRGGHRPRAGRPRWPRGRRGGGRAGLDRRTALRRLLLAGHGTTRRTPPGTRADHRATVARAAGDGAVRGPARPHRPRAGRGAVRRAHGRTHPGVGGGRRDPVAIAGRTPGLRVSPGSAAPPHTGAPPRTRAHRVEPLPRAGTSAPLVRRRVRTMGRRRVGRGGRLAPAPRLRVRKSAAPGLSGPRLAAHGAGRQDRVPPRDLRRRGSRRSRRCARAGAVPDTLEGGRRHRAGAPSYIRTRPRTVRARLGEGRPETVRLDLLPESFHRLLVPLHVPLPRTLLASSPTGPAPARTAAGDGAAGLAGLLDGRRRGRKGGRRRGRGRGR